MKAKAEAEAKAKAEAEAKARAEAESKAKAEAEARAKAEAAMKAKAEAEARRKAEAEAKRIAAEKAKVEAERIANIEAEAKRIAAEEVERKAAEEAEIIAEAKQKAAEEAKAKAEAEAKAKVDAFNNKMSNLWSGFYSSTIEAEINNKLIEIATAYLKEIEGCQEEGRKKKLRQKAKDALKKISYSGKQSDEYKKLAEELGVSDTKDSKTNPTSESDTKNNSEAPKTTIDSKAKISDIKQFKELYSQAFKLYIKKDYTKVAELYAELIDHPQFKAQSNAIQETLKSNLIKCCDIIRKYPENDGQPKKMQQIYEKVIKVSKSDVLIRNNHANHSFFAGDYKAQGKVLIS
jgi:hypothetical protein